MITNNDEHGEDKSLSTIEQAEQTQSSVPFSVKPEETDKLPFADAVDDSGINPLRTEKIGKLILRFSLPAIIGMIANAIYNIVDRLFVGHHPELSESGLAALSFSFPPMLIIMAIAMLFAIGGSVTYSVALGKRDYERAKRAMNNAFFLSISVFAILQIFALIFTEDIAKLFVPKDSLSVLPMTTEYLWIISLGLIFNAINFFGNNFMRANGNSKTSMFAVMLGAIVNIVLDYIFIFPLNMGIAGAAIATVIGQAATSMWIMRYLLARRGGKVFKAARFRLDPGYFKLDWRLVGSMVLIGLAPCIVQMAGSLLMIVLNETISGYAAIEGIKPEIAVGAMAVANSVQTLVSMPMIGLNQGLNPIISYNFGAQQGARVRSALLRGILIASVISTLGCIAAVSFPRAIAQVFSESADNIVQSTMVIRRWFMLFFLFGFNMIAGNYFQYVGKAFLSMIITLLRQVVIIVPLILLIPRYYGYQALFYASPIADIMCFLFVGTLILVEFKRNPLLRRNKINKDNPATIM